MPALKKIMECTNTSTPQTLEEMFEMAGKTTQWNCEAGLWPSETTEIRISGREEHERRFSTIHPAISFPNADNTFTPETLEGMYEQAQNPAQRPRLRFLDLPREIRNRIYAPLLTFEDDIPMDFASCVDCEHEHRTFMKDQVWHYDEPSVGAGWFWLHWRNLCLRLRNFAVSRPVYQEALAFVLAKPLRFTSDLGWVMLYHFLEKLGPEKRSLLKNITVCHPGFSSSPDQDDPVRASRAHNPDQYRETAPYFGLFEEHMPFTIQEPSRCEYRPRHEPPFTPLLQQPYAGLSEDVVWQNVGQFDGTARLLADCPNLNTLTLTLAQFQHADEQFSFAGLENHPIHDYVFPQKDLKLSIIHLVAGDHNCQEMERSQPCMLEIYDQPLMDRTYDGRRINPSFDGRRYLPANRASEARTFFDSVKEKGWKVEEQFYDARGHYPVKLGQQCVNRKMCDFLKAEDEPNIWYECPGNKGEAIEHDGLENLIWKRDPRLGMW